MYWLLSLYWFGIDWPLLTCAGKQIMESLQKNDWWSSCSFVWPGEETSWKDDRPCHLTQGLAHQAMEDEVPAA